jgi:hypothetical protein
MTTDAKEVIASIEDAIERAADAMHSAKEWKSEGVYDDYIAPVLSHARDHIDTLAQECADRAACEASLTEWNEQLTQQRDEARRDAERFRLLATELLNNGMIVGGIDVSEEACAEAVAHGREEPIDDDRVSAARIAVDALRLELESPPIDAARTAALSEAP